MSKLIEILFVLGMFAAFIALVKWLLSAKKKTDDNK
jgi:cbb3-type cytochrome oxidase subunit 3